MAVQIKTGVGRNVWGNVLKPQAKKYQDGPQKGQPVIKDGQPVMQWQMGLAIPEAEFQASIWPAMYAEALTGYPNGVPGRFSWKIKQASDVDKNGKLYSEREGYAGHVVLTISTEVFAPTVVKFDPASGNYRQMTAEEIKPGDYFVAVLDFKVHVAQGQNTPSMYVNPVLIEHVGYGQAIISASAPDPKALLGGASYQLPAGASAMPLAPVAGLTPPMTPGAAPMPGMAPMPGVAAPLAPVAPPPPPPPPAPVAGPQRPTDPSHIANAGTANELWWNGAAWTPAVAAPVAPPPPPAPTLPPAAVGFANGPGGMAPPAPGVPPLPGR
jgi:hypothetical protein